MTWPEVLTIKADREKKAFYVEKVFDLERWEQKHKHDVGILVT